MTLTKRLEGLINAAFANGKTEVFDALRLLRDDVAKLEDENARLREAYNQWESSLAILP